ncbi:SRPBCC family protein [Azospirillum sp.]|uniref:SRPBCC family protein n=1 Tax=Azospirillum sp. TaxID=34012 RepID=UPI003D7639BC
MSQEASGAAGPVFSISRVFAAPRPLVWRAWTDPAMLARWFGPKGCTAAILTMDLRPGGYQHARMEMPGGLVIWGKYVYRAVEEPSRLVWEHSFADAHGNVVPSPFGGAWPLRLLSTVTFEDLGAQGTKITVTWVPMDAAEEERTAFEDGKPSMTGGWTGSFEQLDAFLAGVTAA